MAHNLYYFSNQKPRDFIWLDNFIEYLLNKSHWFLFLESKNEREKNLEIRELIDIFKEESVFETNDAVRNNEILRRVCLGPRGWEVYSWSYLIFHDMGKLTGLILTFIGFLLGLLYPLISEWLRDTYFSV